MMSVVFAVVITHHVLTVPEYLMVLPGQVIVAVLLQVTQVMIVMTVLAYQMVTTG